MSLTYEEWCTLKMGSCFYCGVEFPVIRLYCEKLGIRIPYITIDRKDNGVGYEQANCVSACFLCNRVKSNFFSAEEMKEIAARFIAPKIEKFREDVWDEFTENLRYDADETFDG